MIASEGSKQASKQVGEANAVKLVGLDGGLSGQEAGRVFLTLLSNQGSRKKELGFALVAELLLDVCP